nr:hypothetical protein [Janthinobacterium sp. Marseille]
MKPTFDEWFKNKHGSSFDDIHKQNGCLIAEYMFELSKAMRQYVSEMVQ